jgi:hypothetical protein
VALASSIALVAPVGAAQATKGAGVIPEAHECIPRTKAERGDASIPWEQLSNPILRFDDHMIKDQTLRLIDGEWHLFYSERFEVPIPGGTGHASRGHPTSRAPRTVATSSRHSATIRPAPRSTRSCTTRPPIRTESGRHPVS